MDKIAGQIYLILMCNTLKDYIYKVGRSINFYDRNRHHHFSNLLNVIHSDDMEYDESEILKIFNKNCKLIKGREFFENENGDNFVLKLFLNYFINKINKNIVIKDIIEDNNKFMINSTCEKDIIPVLNKLIQDCLSKSLSKINI